MLCKIGSIEVWRILEICAPFLTPEELFPTAGPDVSEVIAKYAPEQLCSNSGRLILPVQGFLLKTLTHIILVDSCVGNDKTVPGTPNWHQRSDNRFMSALIAAGVRPGDVDYVLCTHLHTDHVGWNTRLEDGPEGSRWVPTFPNARYLMPAADEEVARERQSDLYLESVLPVIEAGQSEMVTANHKLGDEITLIPTPGHTAGHVSVLLKSNSQEAIITGDALHSTVQCWQPEWHFKYDSDAELAAKSRRQLLESASESSCRVLGSHFSLPSIGRIRTEGNAFRWDAD